MLEFERVSSSVKGVSLQEISFRLEDGYIMTLAGENGAGKTTLLRHILEPEQEYTGRILVDGTDVRRDRNACLNRLAYVSDDWLIPGKYMPGQLCDLYSCFYEKWNQALLEQCLTEWQVPQSQRVDSLSRGERFRLQIAIGMAHDASLFLMDEVTAGMDPLFRRELWRIMRGIAAREGSVLLVTHIMDEIRTKSDYCAVLQEGRLISFRENLAEAGVFGEGLRGKARSQTAERKSGQTAADHLHQKKKTHAKPDIQ